MISLQELYETQDLHQGERYRVTRGKDYLRSVIVGLFVESGELADECDWKPWKTIEENRPAIVEEMADVLIFLLDIGWNYHISGEELAKATQAKQSYNAIRPDHGVAVMGD